MITFRRAIRENVPLIIGVAGATGSGKTYSALRLAAGIANGKRFAVIDTEAGRALHYADEFDFDHGDLRPPFRPSTYREAIEQADKAGYPVIVVDSCSHEHAGDGGLIDWHDEELDKMAGQEWKRRESCTMAAWIKPKADHKRFISKLLQLRAHIILCFRAEQKIEMRRGDNGKMEIVPKKIESGFSDWIPICEKNMLYELTASFLLVPGKPGVPQPIKLQEQMRKIIDLNQPLSEETGRQFAQWASGAIAMPSPSPQVIPTSQSQAMKVLEGINDDPTAPYRVKLWAIEHTNQAVNAWWRTVPQELKQDLYEEYCEVLKEAAKSGKGK